MVQFNSFTKLPNEEKTTISFGTSTFGTGSL